jgi:carnosine N-methyltransferase
MDTARNIIDYIEKIWLILKPDGYWINFGPLMYHFDGASEKSLELTYDQIIRVIEKVGFQKLVNKQMTNYFLFFFFLELD